MAGFGGGGGQGVNPNGGGVGFGGGPHGTGKKTISSSPGLLTSTGGLFATTGYLLAPAWNNISQKPFIVVYDPSNFNCDEDAQYTYRQEANYDRIPGEGRECSIHLVILKYRELGIANFSINITVFKKLIDDFITIQIPVKIPYLPLNTNKRKNSFPDNRIHTIRIAPSNGVVQGERPQASITYKANSGPVSVTKLVLCGNADELSQQ